MDKFEQSSHLALGTCQFAALQPVKLTALETNTEKQCGKDNRTASVNTNTLKFPEVTRRGEFTN